VEFRRAMGLDDRGVAVNLAVIGAPAVADVDYVRSFDNALSGKSICQSCDLSLR
jgi:hypothetical protein